MIQTAHHESEHRAAGRVPRLAPLATAAGLELGAYRPEHVAEAVRRSLARERVGGVGELVRLLLRDAGARARFRRSVAVSFSGFFRDPAQFALLESELLPTLLGRRGTLTVWSAGCADGSEVYSLALVLERLGALERSLLLGSDVLEENLAIARAGSYPDVAISPQLRRRVRWQRFDLLCDDAPARRWKLVLCRNVAIYLTPEGQRRAYGVVAQAVAPGGVLMLGRSERLADADARGFERIAPHVYRKCA